MTLAITRHGSALHLAVKVVPGASRDRIVGTYGNALKIQVAVAAEAGRANERLTEVLAAALGLPRRAVTLVSGHASPRKVVAVCGLDADTLRQRLLT